MTQIWTGTFQPKPYAPDAWPTDWAQQKRTKTSLTSARLLTCKFTLWILIHYRGCRRSRWSMLYIQYCFSTYKDCPRSCRRTLCPGARVPRDIWEVEGELGGRSGYEWGDKDALVTKSRVFPYPASPARAQPISKGEFYRPRPHRHRQGIKARVVWGS